MPILFLDTGYHFPETLSFRDRLVREWGLNLITLRGDKSEEYAVTLGRRPLYETAPDHCCLINKVRPMSQALDRYEAWISGVRRDQTTHRSRLKTVQSTAGGKVRIHPMLSWTTADVERYIQEHNLPRHPLTDAGYGSIGCAPCTVPAEGREGRWKGHDKTECGLHVDGRRT